MGAAPLPLPVPLPVPLPGRCPRCCRALRGAGAGGGGGPGGAAPGGRRCRALRRGRPALPAPTPSPPPSAVPGPPPPPPRLAPGDAGGAGSSTEWTGHHKPPLRRVQPPLPAVAVQDPSGTGAEARSCGQVPGPGAPSASCTHGEAALSIGPPPPARALPIAEPRPFRCRREGSLPESGAVPPPSWAGSGGCGGGGGGAGSLHGKMQRAGPEEAAGSQAAAGGPGRSGAEVAAAPAGRLLRRELRLLESIFHRGHERFRIGSACPDEISCEFVPGAGARAGASGSRGPPPGPVRIHCNITVRPEEGRTSARRDGDCGSVERGAVAADGYRPGPARAACGELRAVARHGGGRGVSCVLPSPSRSHCEWAASHTRLRGSPNREAFPSRTNPGALPAGCGQRWGSNPLGCVFPFVLIPSCRGRGPVPRGLGWSPVPGGTRWCPVKEEPTARPPPALRSGGRWFWVRGRWGASVEGSAPGRSLSGEAGPRRRGGASAEERRLGGGEEPRRRSGTSAEGRGLGGGAGPRRRRGASAEERGLGGGAGPRRRSGASAEERGLGGGAGPRRRRGASAEGRGLGGGAGPRRRRGASAEERGLGGGAGPRRRGGAAAERLNCGKSEPISCSVTARPL
ncbi:ubiquitin-conjugating enzyme E2 Q1 [Indicator indicator]|uniref:ubiquitin-conjugating enzyme E2 Q1 n=1 Tax=Indicator indicator TaxID=1002788 RepID=UPI0023DF2FEC|nr:ubiquitin-conjugating enzyme E2 Q1 [Indicator indicator]